MIFHAWMQGEDGLDFTVEVEADTIGEARDKVSEDYPESRCKMLFDPKVREEQLQREANARYEEGEF